ncbi:hypothetical protein [Halobiforma nitratireducens]|uniref:Uncharacterized protein n=1 Tax=Halobiforma nitratireducens JCM 10879 TaxID=1227454 RepID=M0M0G5_9EURY|nr:hypothetical protein [Halobiforma nitratireducens]EMA39166.1 hypothetical protein C446_08856 [Halobiforma nitratireducens JCM 10879]
MHPAEHQLRDCGHVGQLAGICQYLGCANEVCPHCLRFCETCGATLCPAHQAWLDGHTRVFCKDHARKYLIAKIIRRIIPGLGTASADTDRTTPSDVIANDIEALFNALRGRRNQ